MFEIAAHKENQDNILFDLKAELEKYALKKKQPMISAEEYIDCENDESIGENLTDEDIVKLVKSTYTEEKEECDEGDNKEEEENKISIKEAEKHYSELLKYFENNSDFYNESDLEHFLAIKNKMDSIRRALTVQTSLDNYLIK